MTVLNVQVCLAWTACPAIMALMASRDRTGCPGLMGKEGKEVKVLHGWLCLYPDPSIIPLQPEAALLILVQSYWDIVPVKGLSAT